MPAWARFGCVVLLLVAAPAVRPEDWPRFRGVNGSGVSASRGLPVSFSNHENVRWQAELGEGVSSPIVVGGKVCTTGMADATTLVVYCHEAATGRLLWKCPLATGTLPRITPPNSHASSTPTGDGKRFYLHVSTLGLVALDAESGREVWRCPIGKPAYLMHWGAASSPIVHRDMVFFCLDDDLSSFLVAVDAGTGKIRWKTPRPDMLAGYAVPVLCEANGRTDLVVAGTGKLKGYDPETGKERWTCNTLVRTLMTSPVVHKDVIHVAVQSYGDATRILEHALLEWLDTNQDGKLSRAEVPKEFHDKFDRSDRNKDGILMGEELKTAFQDPGNLVGGGTIVQAIRGGGSGDVTKSHLLWNVTQPLPSNLSSPLRTNGRLFLVKAGGLSSNLDANTGKILWERKRIRNLGDYYASPLAADGKIFAAARNGFVVVLEDSPRLKVLANNDMGGEIIATPAIADGRLFVRTRDRLYCISEERR